ncbi:MAG: serine hydrolase [Chlamydiales bacterium]|nr:serine hydrolase [Chlamydiia bacterium]MCP5508257.1 serine hydrolase [Chlamydiales bacterium]
MRKCSLLFVTMTAVIFAEPIEELDTFIEKALTEWNVPGVAVSVVKEDKVLLSKGYGIAKIGTEEKVDSKTVFQLASITKALTSAALAVEVDKGRLTWDEEVILNLPQFALKDPYPTRYTTARDLLAHRTGLPAFGGDLLGKMGYNDSEILHRIRFIDPASSFRDKAHYSNAGYFIAGELLAAITGKSYEQTVRDSIFTPLKMSQSGFAEKLDNDNVAYPHAFIDGKLTILDWDITGGFPAAGAATSTADDMAKWMSMYLAGGQGVIKPETIDEMFASSMAGEASFSEAPPINDYSGFNFGLGWDNFHFHGKMIVEKGGGLDGIRTVTTLIPQLGVGITVMCNLNLTLFPEAVRAEFLELYLGKADTDIQQEIKERQKQLDQLLVKPEPPKAVEPPQKLALYTGKYSNDLYGIMEVEEKNGQLVLYAGPGRYAGTLTHYSNNTFTLTWPAVNGGNQQVTFTMGPEGKGIAFDTETYGRFTLATSPS